MNIEDQWHLIHQLHKRYCVALAWIDVIYYASVVFKVISVCNLMYHNTGHTMYVITYPIHAMTFDVLSASD